MQDPISINLPPRSEVLSESHRVWSDWSLMVACQRVVDVVEVTKLIFDGLVDCDSLLSGYVLKGIYQVVPSDRVTHHLKILTRCLVAMVENVTSEEAQIRERNHGYLTRSD